MTTYAQYVTQRTAALTTYQSAVTAFISAMTDLAALDRVVMNRKAMAEATGTPLQARTFAFEVLQDMPRVLSHPDAPVAPQRLEDAIQASVKTYLAALT